MARKKSERQKRPRYVFSKKVKGICNVKYIRRGQDVKNGFTIQEHGIKIDII